MPVPSPRATQDAKTHRAKPARETYWPGKKWHPCYLKNASPHVLTGEAPLGTVLVALQELVGSQNL
jgi:hypothetical protein